MPGELYRNRITDKEYTVILNISHNDKTPLERAGSFVFSDADLAVARHMGRDCVFSCKVREKRFPDVEVLQFGLGLLIETRRHVRRMRVLFLGCWAR